MTELRIINVTKIRGTTDVRPIKGICWNICEEKWSTERSGTWKETGTRRSSVRDHDVDKGSDGGSECSKYF
jgi:hypothetical protein